jgi:hypothetical protein
MYIYIYVYIHLSTYAIVHLSIILQSNPPISTNTSIFFSMHVFHIFPIILRSRSTVRSHFIPFSPNKSAMENFHRGRGHLQGIGCCAEVGLHRVQGAEELNLPWGSQGDLRGW